MEVLETPQIDAETDAFSLIDVSASDDDFLLASSSEPSIADNADHIFTEGAPTDQPSDSLVLHKPGKTGKCNLRKSLAWDSAFFTNAGVLDPEELSSIMEGSETGVKQSPFLPGIQEELSKSTDSISTFQSDNVTLESLEADLFCDIRASIQRCSKSSTKESSGDVKIHGEEPKNDCSTKIPEPSRKLAKPKTASNKLNMAARGPMRTLKPGSVCKQEIKPPVNRSREPTSLLSRPLKPASGPSLQVAATTKRMSISASRVKSDSKAAGNVKGAGKGTSLPDASHQVDSRKPLPKAPSSSKISAASSVLNRTKTYSSRSSCDSSSSSASENVRKFQMGVIRKKTLDKNVSLLPGVKNRASTNTVEKVKSQNKQSHLSDYLKSRSTPSCSISPASSISEWSTESCSSTATVNQKHFGLNPCPPTSHDVGADSNVSQNLLNLSSDRALGDHDNQVPISSQSAIQPSIGSAVSNPHPGSAKPSGLRMPSPNIGFFDGAKAGGKTPSSSSQPRSALPSSLPRSAAGTPKTSGATNKTRLGFGTSASKITESAAATAKPKEQIIDANLKTDAARTPLTVKNRVSNVVEVSTSPPGSGIESFSKGDAVPSLEITQKGSS
ncbi:flocculation protein FLO11-like [Chenopodium quinoa]|uniref:flocculation protein FLO11-like n=1 Tax=Chenopodium quinoa TaxID=63459 RepID=UPI000B77285C|nr:flocculation protein FLO11-like [Chenopodium quinoa]